VLIDSVLELGLKNKSRNLTIKGVRSVVVFVPPVTIDRHFEMPPRGRRKANRSSEPRVRRRAPATRSAVSVAVTASRVTTTLADRVLAAAIAATDAKQAIADVSRPSSQLSPSAQSVQQIAKTAATESKQLANQARLEATSEKPNSRVVNQLVDEAKRLADQAQISAAALDVAPTGARIGPAQLRRAEDRAHRLELAATYLRARQIITGALDSSSDFNDLTPDDKSQLESKEIDARDPDRLRHEARLLFQALPRLLSEEDAYESVQTALGSGRWQELGDATVADLYREVRRASVPAVSEPSPLRASRSNDQISADIRREVAAMPDLVTGEPTVRTVRARLVTALGADALNQLGQKVVRTLIHEEYNRATAAAASAAASAPRAAAPRVAAPSARVAVDRPVSAAVRPNANANAKSTPPRLDTTQANASVRFSFIRSGFSQWALAMLRQRAHALFGEDTPARLDHYEESKHDTVLRQTPIGVLFVACERILHNLLLTARILKRSQVTNLQTSLGGLVYRQQDLQYALTTWVYSYLTRPIAVIRDSRVPPLPDNATRRFVDDTTATTFADKLVRLKAKFVLVYRAYRAGELRSQDSRWLTDFVLHSKSSDAPDAVPFKPFNKPSREVLTTWQRWFQHPQPLQKQPSIPRWFEYLLGKWTTTFFIPLITALDLKYTASKLNVADANRRLSAFHRLSKRAPSMTPAAQRPRRGGGRDGDHDDGQLISSMFPSSWSSSRLHRSIIWTSQYRAPLSSISSRSGGVITSAAKLLKAAFPNRYLLNLLQRIYEPTTPPPTRGIPKVPRTIRALRFDENAYEYLRNVLRAIVSMIMTEACELERHSAVRRKTIIIDYPIMLNALLKVVLISPF
jgi:hypothetical protein